MPDIHTIAGTWRLVSADHPSLQTSHYVEYVFSVEGERVRGAIARRDAAGQFPVEVVLDGFRLRLRMIPQPSLPPAPMPGDPELPWLVLTPVDDAFEGFWEQASGGRIEHAPKLRLVRVA